MEIMQKSTELIDFNITENGIAFDLTGKSVRLDLSQDIGSAKLITKTLYESSSFKLSPTDTDLEAGYYVMQISVISGEDVLKTQVFDVEIKGSL